MKRKFALIEDSDDDVVSDTIINKDHVPNISPKHKQRNRFKQILYINLIIVSIFLIPFLAIKSLNQGPILDTIDKLIGERCSSHTWVPKNITQLKKSLENNLFGQHIAQNVILSSLSRRWGTKSSHQTTSNNKPLVMSFHGWTGSGKNFVAKYIAEALFKKGLKSQYVKTFISTVHFYDDLKVQEYQQNLRDWVLGNVTSCSETMFIFDEVDKLPEGLLDALRPFMDHSAIIDGVDMSQCMFLLLSNTGGKEITKKSFEAWEEGKRREDLRLADFENMILKGAFNEGGGLKKSAIINKSVIDVYIPFLPLEQQHVRQCAQRNILERGYDVDQPIIQEIIHQIISDMSFWPQETPLYSTTGCKRVAQKVDELLYEHNL